MNSKGRVLFVVALSAVLAAVVAACGGGDPAKNIKAQNPQGSIGGATWAMTAATVTNSNNALSVTMLGDTQAACATGSQDAGFILFTVPAQVGERPLQIDLTNLSDPSNQTLTFVTPPSNNNIATDGIINVTAVSSSSVTIGLQATAGTDNVNGTFTANVCQ